MAKCNDKNKYNTAKFAYKVAKKSKLEKGIELYPYRCTMCNWYHLTSTKLSKKAEQLHGKKNRDSSLLRKYKLPNLRNKVTAPQEPYKPVKPTLGDLTQQRQIGLGWKFIQE